MTHDSKKNIEVWVWEENVLIGKTLVQKTNEAFLDLVRVLFRAREVLTARGRRNDSPSKVYRSIETTSRQPVAKLILPTETDKSDWSLFCKAVGISLRTAQRYLMDYLPDQDRLMTEEEKEQRQGLLLIELFKEIERHKANKELSWRPYPWNDSLERRYAKWLASLEMVKSIDDHMQEQAELFSREYLALLARQLEDDPTPEEILYQHELVERYRTVVTPAVPARDQISIVRLVDKSVNLFDPSVRADVARSIAKVLMDLADKMEE